MNRYVKNTFKVIFIFIFATIILLGLVYLGLGYYYADSFSYGTRINGIYCTGHTPEEVDRMLNERYSYEGLTIETDDDTIFIAPEDIDFTYDFKSALGIFLHNQNSWLWPANLIYDRNKTLNPIVGYDIAKLDQILDSYEIFIYDTDPVVEIISTDGIYGLIDTTKHRPDSNMMRQAVTDCIYNSQETLVLDDSYYYDVDYTPEQKKILRDYDSVSRMLGAHITYVFGDEKVELTDDIVAGFIKRDDNGELIEGEWSKEAIETWVDVLADEYDTVGAKRTFKATGGYEVEVVGGTYGNEIDRYTEKDYLTQAIENKISEEHEPAYLKRAALQGHNDIGDTYVEVNMTDQKLYYYMDSVLKLETDVVTGDIARKRETPPGTYYVYFKQKNRTLIGPNYQTPVYRWMAVNGHIGIHDAYWRKAFGGDIYLTDGSHGCVNIPKDKAEELYDILEVGTPVVMFYVNQE